MDQTALSNSLKAAFPVMISYVAIGLACGMVLFDVEFSLFQIMLISIFVYSGASQFLLASMILSGASLLSILLTTFFLNLRMILMSASLANYIKKESPLYLFLFGISLTDESFGLNYTYFQTNDWTTTEAISLNIANYVTWVVSTVFGGALASVIEIDTTVMSFAIVALFISMMVNQFVDKKYIITAVIAVVLTIIFTILLQNNISIVIAAILSSFIGYLIDEKSNAKEEETK